MTGEQATPVNSLDLAHALQSEGKLRTWGLSWGPGTLVRMTKTRGQSSDEIVNRMVGEEPTWVTSKVSEG